MLKSQGDCSGAVPDGANCRFLVWAPYHKKVDVKLIGQDRIEPLDCDAFGYHRGLLKDVVPGARYKYRLNGGLERPDPASRFQPEGVHEASEVVDLDFSWTDHDWSGVELADYVIYELHVGTFTQHGTFDAIGDYLEYLTRIGVTAIEIMPVAQFPGTRNWGYDGVFPFAVQHSYGGPKAMQRFVNACHERKLAVVLDVVYNHLGPEGNYLGDFGPYFNDRYRTPWGAALNFDGEQSDAVRRFFIENALHWIRDFHIDALRLDAVHAVLDQSPFPFLEELANEVHAVADRIGRKVHLFAESDMNDPKLINSTSVGGIGLDAMWCDDFHHSVHALLTGEQSGYYVDFGQLDHLALAWEKGMTYSGGYSSYRKRRHGRPLTSVEPQRLVVCVQNHDQIGNRAIGDRLGTVVDFAAERLAAGVLTLSPFTPIIFMGQEYGETAPFQYFVSHSDSDLVDAVREGRQKEFRSFGWQGTIPDPMSEQTFRNSTLDHQKKDSDRHKCLLDLYTTLVGLRRTLSVNELDRVVAMEEQHTLFVQRGSECWMVFHFGSSSATATLPVPTGHWKCIMSSSDDKWRGPGTEPSSEELLSDNGVSLALAPLSFCVYTKVTYSKDSDD